MSFFVYPDIFLLFIVQNNFLCGIMNFTKLYGRSPDKWHIALL